MPYKFMFRIFTAIVEIVTEIRPRIRNCYGQSLVGLCTLQEVICRVSHSKKV